MFRSCFGFLFFVFFFVFHSVSCLVEKSLPACLGLESRNSMSSSHLGCYLLRSNHGYGKSNQRVNKTCLWFNFGNSFWAVENYEMVIDYLT